MVLKLRGLAFAVLILPAAAPIARSQQIPNDAVHLPQKIGPSKSGLSRVDAVSVAGKVTFEGIPNGERPPVAFVAVYMYGRLVGRRQVTPSGSYTVNDVPREGSTIVVEVENIEVASSQVLPSPADITYRDFSIQWNQVPKRDGPAEVVSVSEIYTRLAAAQKNFDSAVEKLVRGNPEDAISLLRSIVLADPGDFEALAEIGNGYLLTGDLSEAKKAFIRSLEVRVGFRKAKLGLGRVFVFERKYEEAIETLADVVKSDPLSADANHFLGEAYLLQKKGSKAVPHLEEALRLAPTRKAEIHLQLAALYNGAGLKERAASEYIKFLEKVPGYDKRKELKKYIEQHLPNQKKG